ncbi:guanylate cyclase, putative [Perkinsus marinus ATCC 50983]|uniref:Guanylate cyclase, putative n=1 Tax=Perkinsus marinus (strain ATCC 50983 / TXsc) TaxID=423536 RepID=C5LU32_PERM5|nr:guanylate cyclase, putative [Perkinsus marinus ATCC 50983]EEQ99830.1 guanylate cyclase, putative [Perkinsus marinus ATCC 50983]|eukprot:XP_002767113.1 guanylate cyclase, putative [Perkinsus marinus ATCC 50983]
MSRAPSATFFIDLVCNAREVVDARSKKRAQKKELTQKMVMADEGVAGEGDDLEDLQNTINELAVKEVLIIDDSDDTATILRPMLVDRAYKTNTVTDGFAALDYFNMHPMPDIVIMETELPGNLPGLDFLSQFRREKPPEVPILVITKSKETSSHLEAIRRGATAVYTKPVTEEKLPIIIDHIFALIRNRYHVQHENKAKVNYEVMGRVMPKFIINRLRGGATMIADKLECVSCVAAVVHQFPLITQAVPVTQLVVLMNKMTNSFDQLCKDNGMYSVLSNGERFLAVCGHESTNDEHTEVALRFASKLLKAEQLKIGSTGQTMKLKIGVNTGLAYAGVIGGRAKAPQYAFFGPGVQIAEWLAETGVPSHPHVGNETYKLIMREHEGSGLFSFQERGELRVSDSETLQTWLFKEKADQDLCHLKALGVLTVGGATGDDSGDMLERIQELEAELSILHGTSASIAATATAIGNDGGVAQKVTSQADLIQEQLRRKGTINANNAISLVEPMERICETLMEVVAYAEEEEGRAAELLERKVMAQSAAGGKLVEEGGRSAGEASGHPILLRLADLEGRIKELNSQATEANVEARRAHRVLRDLVKIGFHVGDQTDMVPSQEKAEEMITSMEEVVNSIVMATGLAQEIESEQKRIAAEEAVVEEEENDNGSEADGGGGKEDGDGVDQVGVGSDDAMHPLIKTMRTLQKEIDFIQDYVADTEDLLEAVTGGTAANSSEPQGLFGLQVQQLQTALLAKEEELKRLEEQLNSRGEEAQIVVKLQKDLTDTEIRRGCLQGELEATKMEISRLKTKGYVLKQRERRSPITEMSRRSGTDTESADVEGLRRLLAAKQAEAEMYKSAVADRPLNNAAAVMKQQNDIIHQLNNEIVKMQNEAAARAGGKSGHTALVAGERANRQIKDLQEALLNAQQDVKHLMLEMRYHHGKTSQLASDNQILAKDNQTMQAKLLAMASKMELMQQVSYHLPLTSYDHLPPQTLRHREIELADPRHMIRQVRDQMLLPGDKVSGLIKAGFGRQGYGMPPSLGLGHPVTSSNTHDLTQSSTLMVEELNTAGPSSERRMGTTERTRPLYDGYPEPRNL